MKKKVHERIEAIRLREEGKTYKEIIQLLNVSKASLSLWLKGVEVKDVTAFEKKKRDNWFNISTYRSELSPEQRSEQAKISAATRRAEALVDNPNYGTRQHNCYKCGERDAGKFYGNKKDCCASCHNKITIEKGIENRVFAITHLGGKCRNCGFDKYRSCLDVHHLDPSIKDKKFRHMRGWSRDRLLKEIASCVLLCKICHAAHHAGELILNLGVIHAQE